MKNMKFNCPRCNALQKFGKRKREIAPNKFEIYIQCSVCRWSEVIIRGDSDTIHNEREISRLKARSKGSDSLTNVLRRKVKKRNE